MKPIELTVPKVTNYYREFVKDRLRAMESTPGMWGSTIESFGLQLLLLIEFWELDSYPDDRTDKRLLMPIVFGPGPVVHHAYVEDEWARDVVRQVRRHLRIFDAPKEEAR